MMKLIFKNRFLYITLGLLLSLGAIQAQKNDPSRYASQSVLSQGDWSKIKIDETGFYKITYEKLKEWGISEPKNVQIYGYGGWILDQDFLSTTYLKDQDDLPQVSVWMSKSRDSFGPGDYILFYAKGSLKWKYNKTKGLYEQEQNPYSSDSYYFVTESTDGPKIAGSVASASMGAKVVDSYFDYYLHEKEIVNISQTGREFYGENFRSKNPQDFAVPLPGFVAGQTAVDFNFIGRTTAKTASVSMSINGSTIIEAPVDSTKAYYEKAKEVNRSVYTEKLTDNNTINITYKAGSNSDENVHLNFFRLNYTRSLRPYGAVTLFRSKVLDSNLGFTISDATDKLLVFDVTNGEQPTQINANLSGSTLSFAASNTTIKEYAMVDISKKIPEPSLVGKVANQNLHALQAKEMIIIVRPFLRKYAEDLAKIHADDSGLQSLIVEAEDIYNEFSSGKPDVTAYRRFVKMFYDRANSESEKPQYLLMFGDATYDNRFLQSPDLSERAKKAMLLCYESPKSIHEETSYVTDDYIGFLDDEEGVESALTPHHVTMIESKLDIGIGRLPVQTETEASAVVAKIKSYITDNNKGIWKNNIAFVADDMISGSNSPSSERLHTEYSENYANSVSTAYPNFNINKIYMDSYNRVPTANGGRYPVVNDLLLEKINSGLLFLNYVGHGSTKSWSHEDILNLKTIKDLTNKHYPVLITATCDFGRFDAAETSGGEAFLLNPNGGAIALFTTVRVVYVSYNNLISQSLFNHIFEKKNGQPIRLGDIMRNAKRDLTSDNGNKLRFMLLGDPALRLTYPSENYTVKVSEINDIDVTTNTIDVKALSNNVLKGKIVLADNALATDFNGILDAVIFDSKQALLTRGNMSDGSFNTAYSFKYTDFTNLLYSGQVNVENGEFTINFTAPKDILYSNEFGKMNFYARTNDNKNQAQGSFLNYKVGGMDENAKEENNDPQILEAYLNKINFVSGGKVNATPVFHAKVKDDTGINLSNGIGHNLSLTIDGVIEHDLRSSFVSTDGILGGDVKFVIPELTEGKHNLLFRVWDLWNNSSIIRLDFEVVYDYKPVVYDFVLEGNPAKDSVNFRFISDVNGAKVDVKYQVYSLSGILQWTHSISNSTDNEYRWDLLGSGGRKLDPGIYICRMLVSVDGGTKASKSQKLIVLEQ